MEVGAEKVFEEKMIKKFSIVNEKYKPTDLKSLINFNQKKHEENTPRHIIIKLLKTRDKEKKNLKSSWRKRTYYVEEQEFGILLIKVYASQKTMEQYL